MTFKYNTLTSDEVMALSQLAVVFSKELAPNRIADISAKQYQSSIEEIIKDNNIDIYVCKSEENSLLGFMVLGNRRDLLTGSEYKEITELFVIPEIRNQGIGTGFIDLAKQLCNEERNDRLLVTTMEEEDSQAPNSFYLRHGFERIGPSFRCVI